jgi:hypothetical protein
MNPEFDDPNNHVPAVTPDDDWGDIDPHLNSQLPPKRPDAMKSLKAEMVISGYKSIDPDRPAESMSAMSYGQGREIDAEGGESRTVLDSRVLKIGFDKKLKEIQPSAAQSTTDKGSFFRRKRFGALENDDWGNQSKKISTRWMVYVATGLISLISLMIFMTQILEREDKDPQKIADVLKAKPAPVEKATKAEDDILLRLNQQSGNAMKIYAQFASATRIEDFADRVYLKERNLTDLNLAWKPIAAPAGWMPADKSPWTTHQNGKNPYGLLKGVNHDFSKFSAVFRLEGDELKLDWRATVGYGTANFSDLKMGDGEASEIRGWISPSDFYTNTLMENRYHSFLVSSPDKDTIWVYTEIGSELDQKILSMFIVSPITGEYQTEAMVTLSLTRGEQQILPRQWMVSKLLAMDWLDQNTP